MWMNLKSPSFKNQPKQIVMHSLGSTQSRKSSMVPAIFHEWTAISKGLWPLYSQNLNVYDFYLWRNLEQLHNFGGYIDVNLECLESQVNNAQLLIGHLTHEDETTMLSFKHHTPNAQHSTTFQKKQNLNLSWNLLHLWEMYIALGGYFQQL